MPHKSKDFKEAAINHYLNVSNNVSETARVMGCNNKTLRRWIARHEQHGGAEGALDRQNRDAVSYKITENQVIYAVNHLREHQTMSMKELHAIMLGKYPNFNVTPQHLGKVIRNNNLTRKRTKHGHYPKIRYRRETDLRQDLRNFYQITVAHPIDRIVCIDETSLTPFMYRAYSRCNLGEKCIEKTDNNKVFTKHTFIGAITNSQTLKWELYDQGAMSQTRFVAFVNSIIQQHRHRGYLFIFDNAGAHKGEAIRDLIRRTGNQMLYTVPYNPQTNAIENWFSQFKHYMSTSIVRNLAGIRADIFATIRDKILPERYVNYFRYAYRIGEYAPRVRGGSTRRRRPKNYKDGDDDEIDDEDYEDEGGDFDSDESGSNSDESNDSYDSEDDDASV
eukprot:NODE_432_length_8732_cov_0.302907.p2 type:complete len:391 gc:universal NODE_432_length_8732_cov_0.302907:2320-1148(-)